MRIAYFILLSLCFSSCRLAKQSVSPIQPETDFAILVADNHEIWVKKQDCLDYFHKLDSQKHDIKNVTQLKYALESYTPCKFGTTNSGAPKIDSITTNSSFDETKLELFGVLFNLVFKLAKRHKIYVFDFTTKQWVNYHTKLFKGLHGKSIEIIDKNGKTILYYMLAIANVTPRNSMNMNGLDLYDFHARQYDPVLGRFTTPDPLSEKYYHLSPYAYCASNPLRYIDPTGKDINLTGIIGHDENFKTNYTDKIITDLSFITGMSLFLTAENTWSYKKDSDGNMIVHKNTKGEEIGSSKARSILSKSIDSTESVMVMHYAKSVADSENNIIGLSGEQINLFIEGANNIDSRTLGWGMTFLHELTHTKVGGNYKDIGNNEENTIDLMNSIRCEINELGYNFGVRMQHQAYKINGNAYIPFDFNSLGCISKGITPSKESKYIKF